MEADGPRRVRTDEDLVPHALAGPPGSSRVSGPVQKWIGPSVRRSSAARPRSSAGARSPTTASMEGARGLVSMAVTKIEWGRTAGSATRP